MIFPVFHARNSLTESPICPVRSRSFVFPGRTGFFAFFLLPALIVLLAGSSASASGVALKAFTLKDGRVHKGGAALDCAVNEIPPEISGAVRFWSFFDLESSDAVTESESGVWFFSSAGESLRHVPLESESVCQDVIFSPDGNAFVIETGAPAGTDVFFYAYGERPERTAELSGVRGSLAWLDPVRFVMTRIDGTREGPNYENRGGPAFGWRTSIVLFDIVAKESSVLKASTGTQNFWLDAVIEDGKALSGREECVQSAEDWGDEEKQQTRDIRVEIPVTE